MLRHAVWLPTAWCFLQWDRVMHQSIWIKLCKELSTDSFSLQEKNICAYYTILDFFSLPFVSGMLSWNWKVGWQWTRNWTLQTVVSRMKLAGATPDSCHLRGTSIQLLRLLHAGELESTPHSRLRDAHTKTHTCAEHPYARQVASALVAGEVGFQQRSAGWQRLSRCFQTVIEC